MTLPLALTLGEPAGIGPTLRLRPGRAAPSLICRRSTSSPIRNASNAAPSGSASMPRWKP